MQLRDWDPGIFGLTGGRRDLYHYDMSGAMGTIDGEWCLVAVHEDYIGNHGTKYVSARQMGD